MARVAASKKTKEDVVSDGKGSTPASKTGAGTPPAPSFPAENSRNTETAGTPKDAGNATGGAVQVLHCRLKLPLETERRLMRLTETQAELRLTAKKQAERKTGTERMAAKTKPAILPQMETMQAGRSICRLRLRTEW